MRTIGMNVYRPTADCIWNTFLNSGKRHFILTGNRGSGKTTLLSELFPENLPGITSWAEPRKAAFLMDNTTKETARIGVYDETLSGFENKMVSCMEGFETVGIPALRRSVLQAGEWVRIDEIGYLECNDEAYPEAILELMQSKRLAAVVRKQNLPFLQKLCSREDVFLLDLDQPFGNIGCVIMASGLGKRFGGNKLLADFGGSPLITRILDATEGIFAKRVVVTRHEEVAKLCQERGIQTILHDLPYRSDTVRLGMETMTDMEHCMFCTGDQPLLRQETIAALALSASNNKEFIWRTMHEGTPGSPVVFPSWAFAELKNLPEGKGGGVIIKKHPELVRYHPVQNPLELYDIDSSDDLEFLLKQSSKKETI